jgi:hypothetical protein
MECLFGGVSHPEVTFTNGKRLINRYTTYRNEFIHDNGVLKILNPKMTLPAGMEVTFSCDISRTMFIGPIYLLSNSKLSVIMLAEEWIQQ